MTGASLPLVPETASAISGAGACAATDTRSLLVSARAQAINRAVRDPDVNGWLDHVRSASGCKHPIQLHGTMNRVNAATGEIVSSQSTSQLPDGVIYKACGNRREVVCPSCAQVYKKDAFHLVRSGMVGGKGVSESVGTHPAVFATFTADSFGYVHSRPTGNGGQVKPCRPRRKPEICPHGINLQCFRTHAENERCLSTPLCLDCYDHDAQAVWNVSSGELWRRTRINIDRALKATCRRLGIDHRLFKTRYVKVAEFQKRGVVHFHVIIRLDGHMPGLESDDGVILAPAAGLDVQALSEAVYQAAATTRFTTQPHTANPCGWDITWGHKGVQVDEITLRADAEMNDLLAAGYLAKYSTKDTEAAGHVSTRLNSENIDDFADPDGDHIQRLIAACWDLGLDEDWHGLRRWAHRLGFAGHYLTHARDYSVTFGQLRGARTQWRRTDERDLGAEADEETTLLVNYLTFTSAGWRTEGDALLANTSAAMAREHDRIAREEIAHLASTQPTLKE